MAKADIWMPFYIADYLADTMHLSAAEHGAYLLLILHYWRSGPLVDDDSRLATISRLNDAWSNASSTIKAFFEQRGGMLYHKRIDHEKEQATSNKDRNHARAQAAAAKRWGKDASSNAPSNPQAMPGYCPSPSPSPSLDSKALSGKPDDVVLSNGKSKFKGDAEIILAFLNEKAKKRFPPTKANLDFIAGRLQEGATVADCRQVIAMKVREWAGDAENRKYLRPATLFNTTKFSQYVGELGSPT